MQKSPRKGALEIDKIVITRMYAIYRFQEP